MKQEIYYWKYALRSKEALNKRGARTRHEGALIRLANGGVGGIHPWPELGDLPMSKQLGALKEGGMTPLIEGALDCAKLDGEARHGGVSLLQNPIPESHWLAKREDVPSEIEERGFTIVKLKGGQDIKGLRENVGKWGRGGFRIRIDMNESVSQEKFLEFWRMLGDKERQRIELVEDPAKWTSDSSWAKIRESGVSIAVDRDPEKRIESEDILVIKPACPSRVSSRDRRLFVTSYMDHAIGQMWAAFVASSLRESRGSESVLTCGLMTHHCFEPDEFFERIKTKGSVLLPQEGGTGLGFDDLLEKLPWKRLT